MKTNKTMWIKKAIEKFFQRKEDDYKSLEYVNFKIESKLIDGTILSESVDLSKYDNSEEER